MFRSMRSPTRISAEWPDDDLMSLSATYPAEASPGRPVAHVASNPSNPALAPVLAAVAVEPTRRADPPPAKTGVADPALAQATTRVKELGSVALEASYRSACKDSKVASALNAHRRASTRDGGLRGLQRAAECERLALAYQTIALDTKAAADSLAGAVGGTPPNVRGLTRGQRAALRDADPVVRTRAAMAQVDAVLAALGALYPELMAGLVKPR